MASGGTVASETAPDSGSVSADDVRSDVSGSTSSDDDEDDSDDEKSSSDGSASSGSGSVAYHPASLDIGSIRNAIVDGMHNALPKGIEVAGDGGIFENREGLLPDQPIGYYTISIVPTPGISGAGPQRIITGQGGEMYYTSDHYKTFTQIK